MFKRKILKPLTFESVVFWTYDRIWANDCICSAGVNKPVQVFPVYPSLHAHCDDEHTILPSNAVHLEVDVHPIPTTAETVKGKSLYGVEHLLKCALLVHCLTRFSHSQ